MAHRALFIACIGYVLVVVAGVLLFFPLSIDRVDASGAILPHCTRGYLGDGTWVPSCDGSGRWLSVAETWMRLSRLPLVAPQAIFGEDRWTDKLTALAVTIVGWLPVGYLIGRMRRRRSREKYVGKA